MDGPLSTVVHMATRHSALRAEILAAIADANTAADAPNMRFGEARVAWAARDLWNRLAEIVDTVDDDRFGDIIDRFFGAVLGILVGQTATDHTVIGDPVASLSMASDVDGARRVIATLAELYAAHERGLPATAFALTAPTAARRRQQIDDATAADLDAWRDAQRPR